MNRAAVAITVLTCACLLAQLGACKGERPHWDPKPPPAVHVEPAISQRQAKDMPHPRILFTADRIARLKRAAQAKTAYWKKLEDRCAIFVKSDQSAGYLGLQWGEAIGNLVTCYYGTGDDTYRDRAMVYVRALVEDKQAIGDGAGGDAIVQGNSGYPIRAFGLYAALAYDWLHDAPGMEELRPQIAKRLEAWLGWYMAEGYLNDSPYSNYFWGYFATLAMAGLATHGEVPSAEIWLSKTRELLDQTVIPGFQAKLKGGEWAEGWQYGQLVAMEVALLVDGFYTATGADYAPSFSWLGEIVHAHLHRTHPGAKSWYGNGTQHVRPPPPDGSALASALLVLERTDPQDAARARFIVGNLFPPLGKERIWFATIAQDPDGDERDPRGEVALSYHLAGPGRTYMRSDWSDDAVWVSLQAGSRVAIDHEHNDQGHFEIWRGNDPLLSDFATQEGYATINHNSLLIDDGKDALNYTPNQGVWGRTSRTTGWFDDGKAVVVEADLTDAWAPKCVERGCSKRAVDRVLRRLVYVRPGVVVTDDRIELRKGSYGATWIGHARSQPTIQGGQASFTRGSARLDLVRLVGGELSVVKEPTPTEDHIYRANRPDGDVWRIELTTDKGSARRHLRTWMQVGAAGDGAARVQPIAGVGLSGAAGSAIAVLFADSERGGTAELPAGTARVHVVGLSPSGEYRAGATGSAKGCAVTAVMESGSGVRPNQGGALTLDCK